MSSSLHNYNEKKDNLIRGIGPTRGLDDSTLTAEAQYSINFSRSNIRFCLSLRCDGIHSFYFIYCYMIKYWAKQKYLLPYYITNEKLTI